MNRLPRVIGVLAALAMVASAGVAEAQVMSGDQPTPKYNLQRWRPAPNPADFLTVYGASVGDHLRLTGGLYFNFAADPLAFNTGITAEDTSIVSHQFVADVYASFNFWEWADLAVVLPVGLSQASESDGVPFDSNFDATGLGDLRVIAKARILELGEFPVGVGFVAALNTPTGDETQLWGDDGIGFDMIVPVEYSPYGNIRLALNGGFRFRPSVQQFASRFSLGHSVLLSGAASIPFFHEHLDFLLEIHGEIDVDEQEDGELDSQERPVEGEIGVRYRLVDEEGSYFDDLAITAAFGLGSGAVGSPSFRGIVGIGYQWVNGGSWAANYKYDGVLAELEECPDPEVTPYDEIPAICREAREEMDSDGDGVPDSKDMCPFHGTPGEIDEYGCSTADMDGDGIPDSRDRCPAKPEDKDGYKDGDGCPDLDNDGDGIADLSDKCPLEQEVVNGMDDEDGCPDVDPDAKVFVQDGKINIKEQVFFESAKAKIKPKSFDLLDKVAKVLSDNPHIGNIEIEGHTDDRGDDDYNKQLSQERADAVKDYLVKKGVDSTRLSAIGYGEERPIADNEKKAGRAQNRRVEFTIRNIDKP